MIKTEIICRGGTPWPPLSHVKIRLSCLQRPTNPQQIPIAEPLVEVTRGALTESRHRGHIVVVEPDGNIVAYLGSPQTVTFLRSSAKPFQALAAAHVRRCR